MRNIAKGSNVTLRALSENADSVIISLGWASFTGEGDAEERVTIG
ncbi:hypothetical protein ACIHAA_15960 [Streptomyces sp. NPDC052040]